MAEDKHKVTIGADGTIHVENEPKAGGRGKPAGGAVKENKSAGPKSNPPSSSASRSSSSASQSSKTQSSSGSSSNSSPDSDSLGGCLVLIGIAVAIVLAVTGNFPGCSSSSSDAGSGSASVAEETDSSSSGDEGASSDDYSSSTDDVVHASSTSSADAADTSNAAAASGTSAGAAASDSASTMPTFTAEEVAPNAAAAVNERLECVFNAADSQPSDAVTAINQCFFINSGGVAITDISMRVQEYMYLCMLVNSNYTFGMTTYYPSSGTGTIELIGPSYSTPNIARKYASDILAYNSPTGEVIDAARTVPHVTLQDYLSEIIADVGPTLTNQTFNVPFTVDASGSVTVSDDDWSDVLVDMFEAW